MSSSRRVEQLGLDLQTIGIVIVDHGSQRTESNELLFDVVDLFRQSTGYAIVEAAHMELSEPSIATAFDRCVERGARVVVIHPYFLLPGRHWDQDIPQLAAEAARRHPGVSYLVTAPLGLHPLMAQIMNDRIQHCLAHASDQAEPCDVCEGTTRCRMRSS